MSKGFKNAQCLAFIPDVYGYRRHGDYWLSCHRRRGHPGKHRVKFQDGRYREWAKGDGDSVVVNEPSVTGRRHPGAPIHVRFAFLLSAGAPLLFIVLGLEWAWRGMAAGLQKLIFSPRISSTPQ